MIMCLKKGNLKTSKINTMNVIKNCLLCYTLNTLLPSIILFYFLNLWSWYKLPIVGFKCSSGEMFLCMSVNLNTDPRLLDDPVRFPELLLDTTEIALAMASTADSLSANVFLSDRSASETHRTSLKSSQAGFGKTSPHDVYTAPYYGDFHHVVA